MGGGGGGGNGGSGTRSPSDLAASIRDAERDAVEAEFAAELGGYLSELLAAFNNRDAGLVAKRVEDALRSIGKDIEGDVEKLFGGSVAKHTYVDGLSDIDTLVLLNRSELAGESPQFALGALGQSLQDRLKDKAAVSVGKIAVTIGYADGMEIQMLPALRTDAGLRVPAWSANRWSEIDPTAFTAALTRHNQRLGGKLVPVIKLAKAVNTRFPEPQQLSGYHLESLAIAAFRGYSGELTPSAMLPHFFHRAAELVMTPMADKTGQSLRVDSHLGSANSADRQKLSHVLDRTYRRMQNVLGTQSISAWRRFFE